MTERRCDQCEFWLDMSGLAHFAGSGHCKRFPPMLTNLSVMSWSWPITMDDWWCGEFKPRAETGGERL